MKPNCPSRRARTRAQVCITYTIAIMRAVKGSCVGGNAEMRSAKRNDGRTACVGRVSSLCGRVIIPHEGGIKQPKCDEEGQRARDDRRVFLSRTTNRGEIDSDPMESVREGNSVSGEHALVKNQQVARKVEPRSGRTGSRSRWNGSCGIKRRTIPEASRAPTHSGTKNRKERTSLL